MHSLAELQISFYSSFGDDFIEKACLMKNLFLVESSKFTGVESVINGELFIISSN